jgi:hypothetical protein
MFCSLLYLEVTILVNLGIVSKVKTMEDGIHLVPPDGPRHQLVPAVGLHFPQHLSSGHRVVAAVQEDGLCAPKIKGYVINGLLWYCLILYCT